MMWGRQPSWSTGKTRRNQTKNNRFTSKFYISKPKIRRNPTKFRDNPAQIFLVKPVILAVNHDFRDNPRKGVGVTKHPSPFKIIFYFSIIWLHPICFTGRERLKMMSQLLRTSLRPTQYNRYDLNRIVLSRKKRRSKQFGHHF